MEAKLFTKNDSGFVCLNCGKEVLPLGYSSRNHCPFCLSSRHLDINPGDRLSECGGIMKPISAEPDPKKGYIITH
ncbi:MAG: RNHCP domain-containing protein, partial [Clostridia bacterium]|nr:RNHCP domain-containing protein [Clostridia bacterium]